MDYNSSDNYRYRQTPSRRVDARRTLQGRTPARVPRSSYTLSRDEGRRIARISASQSSRPRSSDRPVPPKPPKRSGGSGGRPPRKPFFSGGGDRDRNKKILYGAVLALSIVVIAVFAMLVRSKLHAVSTLPTEFNRPYFDTNPLYSMASKKTLPTVPISTEPSTPATTPSEYVYPTYPSSSEYTTTTTTTTMSTTTTTTTTTTVITTPASTTPKSTTTPSIAEESTPVASTPAESEEPTTSSQPSESASTEDSTTQPEQSEQSQDNP